MRITVFVRLSFVLSLLFLVLICCTVVDAVNGNYLPVFPKDFTRKGQQALEPRLSAWIDNVGPQLARTILHAVK